IAAAVRILFARGEIAELARDHGLDRHPGQLAMHAREGIDRLAELHALAGVFEAQLHRALRDADRTRRGLDARGLKSCHQLLEAFALAPAEQVLSRHLEAVAADLVLLHATI